jgi:hypothetical protein
MQCPSVLYCSTALVVYFTILCFVDLELGHNFGSEHDVQNNPDCSPESGGKYIMYPAAVSGRKANNNVSFAFKYCVK